MTMPHFSLSAGANEWSGPLNLTRSPTLNSFFSLIMVLLYHDSGELTQDFLHRTHECKVVRW